MVNELWGTSKWWSSGNDGMGSKKLMIGVLTYEVSNFMSKVVHLWQSLSDNQIVMSKEGTLNSVGVRKLVSEEDDFLLALMCGEFMENLECMARCVGRLAKRCTDPVHQRFEHVFNDLVQNNLDLYRWEYRLKKMERKMKKMVRFVAVKECLYQELDVLAELEQTLRRLKRNSDSNSIALLQLKQKVVWERQEVQNLRQNSLWNRSYDYTVHLLARSLFTIFGRIKLVFGAKLIKTVVSAHDSRPLHTDYLPRSHSTSSLTQSLVYPSEDNVATLSSRPLGRSYSKASSFPNTDIFGMSSIRLGPPSGINKSRYCHFQTPDNPSTLRPKQSHWKVNIAPVGPFKGCMTTATDSPLPHSFTPVRNRHLRSTLANSGIMNGAKYGNVGPFKGCMTAETDSPLPHTFTPGHSPHLRSTLANSGIMNGAKYGNVDSACGNSLHACLLLFRSKQKALETHSCTLGAAALALHYANVIIVIKKLLESPDLIGSDARDNLYNMFTRSLRMALRARLKPYAKNLNSFVYSTDFATHWREELTGILEWLAPLAHNMIRWQSERNFEQQHLVSRTNVLLVQTLYFADQAKTEAAIAELLVGLNYLWRLGQELDSWHGGIARVC
ncbi:type-1 restriction enzyme mjaxp r protein [Thalictrum thalictroides]|uniref:Type-1 restriction enzyme mjaxp r protein n=1 Tax=Thalictrum thalictroides TaxID=46969 RepID=A0A7J6WUL6_THATH|nr:type-1 restriction enzyme mjaxp r protein [Thalictrum thalictroides]